MLAALARLSGGNYCRPLVLLPPQFLSLSKADEATRGRVECGVRSDHLCPSLYPGIQHGTGHAEKLGKHLLQE